MCLLLLGYKNLNTYNLIIKSILLGLVMAIIPYSLDHFQVLKAQMDMASSHMNMSTPTDYNSINFISYRNPNLGIQITHPVSWKPVVSITPRGHTVEFVPAVENEHQQLMPFVTLSIEKTGDDIVGIRRTAMSCPHPRGPRNVRLFPDIATLTGARRSPRPLRSSRAAGRYGPHPPSRAPLPQGPRLSRQSLYGRWPHGRDDPSAAGYLPWIDRRHAAGHRHGRSAVRRLERAYLH